MEQIDTKIQEKVVASQRDMLTKLEMLLSNKLDSFRNEIGESQKQLSERRMSKIMEMNSNSYSFKHNGNEEQYKLNTKVATK